MGKMRNMNKYVDNMKNHVLAEPPLFSQTPSHPQVHPLSPSVDDVIFGGIAFEKMSGGREKISSPGPRTTIGNQPRFASKPPPHLLEVDMIL